MKSWLYGLFLKRVSIDVEEKIELKETEEIKLLNVFCAVMIVWFVVGAALFFYDDRGTFGDMFGSINTLFSGFAFGGIIYTIYQQRAEFRLQREELRLQRKELRLQRDEIAKTNEALDEQVKATNVQRFETTFFNMVGLHNNLVKDIVVTDIDLGVWTSTTAYEGQQAFSEMYAKFKSDVLKKNNVLAGAEIDGAKFYGNRAESIDRQYALFFASAEKKIQTYYKNLFNLIYIIDENVWLGGKEKKYYFRILESQLSTDELLMLFYRTMTKREKEMRIFTKRYELLKKVQGADLIYKEDLVIYNDVE